MTERNNETKKPTRRTVPASEPHRRRMDASRTSARPHPHTDAHEREQQHTHQVDHKTEQRPRQEEHDARTASETEMRHNKHIRRTLGRYRSYGVRTVAVLMIVFTFIGLLWFARPSTSTVEKRALTTYPEFTTESFLDGSYFTQVSLWYSDTYPLREPLVALDHALDSLFGVNPSTQLYTSGTKADEIPAEGTTASGDSRKYAGATAPTEREMAEEVQNQIVNGVYVKDGAAYSIYYFSADASQAYATAINTAADNLAGTANVYSLIVPCSVLMLDDESEVASLGGTDQQAALSYLYSLYDENVNIIETYSIMREHNDEYLFFRTDHHWTELGAYYAYLSYCDRAGIEPSDISTWEKREYYPFVGTFTEMLSDAGTLDPDTIEAYVPTSTNDLTYWTSDGEEKQGNVIADVTGWDDTTKYSCFAAGDQPLERIDNPEKDDGSSVLLVKDSFGCAFVPLLVDSYQTVYVIDFRYYDGNIVDFVEENDIDDVIFLNYLKLATTYTVADALQAEVTVE